MDKDNFLKELLGETRAIYFAMQYGAITYEEAKLRTNPLLQRLNISIKEIAIKHKIKPRYIKFQDLGRNL